MNKFFKDIAEGIFTIILAVLLIIFTTIFFLILTGD